MLQSKLEQYRTRLYIANRRFVARTQATTDVKVYNNLEDVELLVKGILFGKMKSNNVMCKSEKVLLKKGYNTIQAIAITDGKALLMNVIGGWNN